MKKTHVVPSIIAIAFLLGSFGHWPYGYYTLLRIVVCGSAAYIAYLSYESKIEWSKWLFGAISVLFNPIFKVHLDRNSWQVVDVVVAIVFAINILIVKLNKRQIRP